MTRFIRAGIMVFLLLSGGISAQTMDDEIDFLIESVGRDGCAFIRNERRYSGREARQHLRSKRALNSQLLDSTEDFIEKIASRSATSGEPYLIRCRGKEAVAASEWLRTLLARHRNSSR